MVILKHVCLNDCFFSVSMLMNAEPAIGMFYKKGFLRNFSKFTGKQLCQRLFFNKVASLTFKLY